MLKGDLSLQLYVCSFLELYYSKNTVIIDFVEDPWLLVRVSDFRVNSLALQIARQLFTIPRELKGGGKGFLIGLPLEVAIPFQLLDGGNKAHFRWGGPWFKFLRTNLDLFEAN